MPTLTITPQGPAPNRVCKVRANATNGGTAVRIWCENAPPGSAYRKKLDDSGAARVAFNPPTVDAGKDFDFTPDKGGGYVLRLDELARGTGYTGAYEGDPAGAPTESIITSASATLYVATELTSQLGFGADRATLHLHILDDAIIQARRDVHGVTSPRISLPGQPSAKAKKAAESQDVRFAVSLFTNNAANEYPPSRILGDPAAIVDRLIANLNFHLRGTTNHVESASAEQVPDEFLHPTGNAGLLASLNKIKTTLDKHVRNDSGEGTGSGGWHDGEAGKVSWEAVPLVTPSEQTVDACIADLVRCLRLHLDSAVHDDPGGVTPDLFQLSILTWTHELFIKQLVSADSPPANANPLGAEFIARGFVEP